MSDGKPGRPAYEPTEVQRRTVESMTGFGATQMEIGRILGISDATLRKYFETELQQGVIKANTAVAQSLFETARAGNVTAMIFWLKVRAGWKEAPQQIDMRQSYVVRAPAPVDSTREWFARYAPPDALEQDDV
jgi:hypothetical protein